ncbi:uncharacterized protein BXZ73DRAFT_103909 [Epithele typhae]|uniref:uncharacterized protein n=1 Tax=Epithele typhae TaxID=378194 RepID=UPI002007F332|nr:uncharacterized protein BXZ73DRAFT_103909 [Epithele typhae]KAH9923476.1 hypothetical protein BXZ73DRAFT_103909 [Epithele typhae]
MPCSTKAMRILCEDTLKDNVTVIACFEPQGTDFTSTIAWQVETFWANRKHYNRGHFNWNSGYAFSIMPTDYFSYQHQQVKSDDLTTIILYEGEYRFFGVRGGEQDGPKVLNNTKDVINIGWGFYSNFDGMQSVMQWDNVAAGATRVPDGWAPVLSLYVLKNYDGDLYAGGVIDFPLDASRRKWSKDLSTLDANSHAHFKVVWEPEAQDYVIAFSEIPDS